MRLLAKSSIYFLVTSLLVFLFSGTIVYFMLQGIIHEEVDDRLSREKNAVMLELHSAGRFESFIFPKDGSVIFSSPIKATEIGQTSYSDTMIYDLIEEELIPFRQIQFFVTLNLETRRITIFLSLIESDELVEAIIFSLILVFVFTILSVVILNYVGMNRLWRPFGKILDQIKRFDFRTRDGFDPVISDITEFNELNGELVKMTNKLTHDYFTLKEFSENASHEMQTPLAIIQAKLELLFQQRGIEEDNMKALKVAYNAANRLSRLHHELNLLSRIENKEFTERSVVHFKSLVENQVENFIDIIEMKNLKLELNIADDPVVEGNSYLLEILISNLINNAIKHNIEQGGISINLDANTLTISNDGNAPGNPPELLFERFRKGKPSSDSTGLGLSLVKQICLLHELEIRYTYQNKKHSVQITL